MLPRAQAGRWRMFAFPALVGWDTYGGLMQHIGPGGAIFLGRSLSIDLPPLLRF